MKLSKSSKSQSPHFEQEEDDELPEPNDEDNNDAEVEKSESSVPSAKPVKALNQKKLPEKNSMDFDKQESNASVSKQSKLEMNRPAPLKPSNFDSPAQKKPVVTQPKIPHINLKTMTAPGGGKGQTKSKSPPKKISKN